MDFKTLGRSRFSASISAVLLVTLPTLSVAQTIPAHTALQSPLQQFIDPAEMMADVCDQNDSASVCTAKLQGETLAYYKAVGVYTDISNPSNPVPSAARGSLSSWKQTFGFSADPTQPAAGELRSVYFNNGDLQLSRDMHCRLQTFNRSGPSHLVSAFVRGVW